MYIYTSKKKINYPRCKVVWQLVCIHTYLRIYSTCIFVVKTIFCLFIQALLMCSKMLRIFQYFCYFLSIFFLFFSIFFKFNFIYFLYTVSFLQDAAHCWKHRYRTTIHSNSCHTNWSIKINFLYGKLFFVKGILSSVRPK